eukprot:gene2176-2600_t
MCQKWKRGEGSNGEPESRVEVSYGGGTEAELQFTGKVAVIDKPKLTPVIRRMVGHLAAMASDKEYREKVVHVLIESSYPSSGSERRGAEARRKKSCASVLYQPLLEEKPSGGLGDCNCCLSKRWHSSKVGHFDKSNVQGHSEDPLFEARVREGQGQGEDYQGIYLNCDELKIVMSLDKSTIDTVEMVTWEDYNMELNGQLLYAGISGLGLYVAVGVILAHGGAVRMHRRGTAEGGYSFNGLTLTIPLYTTTARVGSGGPVSVRSPGAADSDLSRALMSESPTLSPHVHAPGAVLSAVSSVFHTDVEEGNRGQRVLAPVEGDVVAGEQDLVRSYRGEPSDESAVPEDDDGTGRKSEGLNRGVGRGLVRTPTLASVSPGDNRAASRVDPKEGNEVII